MLSSAAFSWPSVVMPCLWIAWMMSPLRTPLQPQMVSLSGISATSRPGSLRWREEQLPPQRRQIGSAAHPVHIDVLVLDVADQNHAVQAVVFEQQLLVCA